MPAPLIPKLRREQVCGDHTRRPQQFAVWGLFLGLFAAAIPLRAQNTVMGGSQDSPFPDAPSAFALSACVSGTVLDPSGAAVSGAEVTLTEVGAQQGRFLITGKSRSREAAGRRN
jgi:hypothetical protein